MAIVKCKKGHFYDNLKFSNCPVCADKSIVDDEATIASGLFDFNFDGESKTENFDENNDTQQQTIPLYMLENDSNPVTGWLVSITGINRGKSYQIYDGRNFVGRNASMDIIFDSEKMVSRENHFSIVFDKRNNTFYVLPGNAPVSVNNKLVSSPCLISEDDVISFANNELVFIPYCKKGRNWNEK